MKPFQNEWAQKYPLQLLQKSIKPFNICLVSVLNPEKHSFNPDFAEKETGWTGKENAGPEHSSFPEHEVCKERTGKDGLYRRFSRTKTEEDQVLLDQNDVTLKMKG